MGIVNKTLGRLLTFGMAMSFLGLVGSVLLQVFARWFLPSVPSWTEETARIFLIWMVGFGGGLAYRDGGYVNVDLLINLLPKALSSVLLRFGDLIIAAFMALFTYEGWQMTMRMGRRQTSPALYIPMQYVFVAFAALGAFVVLYALFSFFYGLRAKALAKANENAAEKGE